jgi:hypothetical protein
MVKGVSVVGAGVTGRVMVAVADCGDELESVTATPKE